MHHVREFPFLDKAKEKEFWQEKLQVVCTSYRRMRLEDGIIADIIWTIVLTIVRGKTYFEFGR